MGGYLLENENIVFTTEMCDAYNGVIRAFDDEMSELKRHRFMSRAVKRLETYKTEFRNAFKEPNAEAVVYSIHQAICKEHRRAMALQVALFSFMALAGLVGVAVVLAMPYLAAPLSLALAIVGFSALMGLMTGVGVGGVIQTSKTSSFGKVSTSLFAYFKHPLPTIPPQNQYQSCGVCLGN